MHFGESPAARGERAPDTLKQEAGSRRTEFREPWSTREEGLADSLTTEFSILIEARQQTCRVDEVMPYSQVLWRSSHRVWEGRKQLLHPDLPNGHTRS